MVEQKAKTASEEPKTVFGYTHIDFLLHRIVSIITTLTPEVELLQHNMGIEEVKVTSKGKQLLQYLDKLPEMRVLGVLTDNIFPQAENVFQNRIDQCRWDEETKRRVAARRYLSEAERLRVIRRCINDISRGKELLEHEEWTRSRAQEILGDLEPITQEEVDTLIRQTIGNEVFNLAAAQAGNPQK